MKFVTFVEWQKASFFNCLLDMAGQWGTGGSRTGSLSLEGVPLMANSTSEPDPTEEGPLATLARRNTIRNRSLR